MKQKKIIIFSDLDGTLLDKNTFKFDIIEDYFRDLILKGVIIIPSSSKTESELLDFNRHYNLKLSFISENGSAIHGLDLINKKIPNKILISRSIDEIYNIYNKTISSHLKQKIIFISNLNIEEQIKIFGLPQDKLLLAKKRNHSIPIQFKGSEIEKKDFIKLMNDVGLSVQTGGRIMNICDNTNKSKAMSKTKELLGKGTDEKIITIGVGDNQNDIEMLKNCDYACLVKNDNFDSSLINIDNLIKSSEPSPKGWADVIKTAIQKIKS